MDGPGRKIAHGGSPYPHAGLQNADVQTARSAMRGRAPVRRSFPGTCRARIKLQVFFEIRRKGEPRGQIPPKSREARHMRRTSDLVRLAQTEIKVAGAAASPCTRRISSKCAGSIPRVMREPAGSKRFGGLFLFSAAFAQKRLETLPGQLPSPPFDPVHIRFFMTNACADGVFCRLSCISLFTALGRFVKSGK